MEGRYRIDRHLADGGMGSVYAAHDERLARDVAVKVLRPDLAHDPTFARRFRREAQSAARLNDPHVVAVHDQGQDGADLFLVMELVRGRTLRDLLRTSSTFAERLDVVDQMLTGVAAAHAAGIAHRDIKPENVLIDEAGQVKVADFGLARALASSARSSDSDVLIGTASYLAPEQVETGRADTRSDVYSCGLVLFEVLAGRRAFDGPVPVTVAYRHVTEALPTLPAQTPHFDAAGELLALACAKDPAARPADAAELRSQFERFRAVWNQDELNRSAPEQPLTRVVDSQASTRSHTALLGHGATRVLAPTPPPAPPVRSRRWPLIALAGVAAASLVTVLGLHGPLAVRTIPDIKGQVQGEAIHHLRDAGFDVRVTTASDDTVPVGRAVTTSPGAGSHRWPAGTVTLDISSGPRMVAVPSVQGKDERTARSVLAKAGFTLGSVTRQHSTSPEGSALGTTPTAGTRLRHDSRVTLVLSSGPAPVQIPSVIGQDADRASTALSAQGLTVHRTDAADATVPSGKVVSTNPKPGAQAHTGDTVTMTVSTGPEQVAVPDVTGLDADTARSRLEDAGFAVSGPTWIDELFNRSVSSQDPAGGGGAHAARGSTVKLRF